MKTPIVYYGGKSNLKSEIRRLEPDHIQYGEPFCGGATYFWDKEPSEHEFLNDINLWVWNFWQVCQTDFEELQALICSTLHHEHDHRLAREILQSGGSSLEMAWAFWVQTQMSFGKGIFKGFAFDNGGSSVKSANNKKKDFTKKIWERLKRVELFNRDALELIEIKDSHETFLYLDPPYEGSDCGHYKKLVGVYPKLIEKLPSLKSKFLLSTYRNELLTDEMIKDNGWHIKEIQQPLAVSSKDNQGKKKVEVLIWNYSQQGQNLKLF